MNLSKSKYCAFIKCPKCLWLACNRPEEGTKSADVQQRLDSGTEVGKLARGLFGAFVDVTTMNQDGSLDHKAMLQKTQEAMKSGVENICEASFSCDGCYCQADILHKTGDGYAIYEVKSANSVKDINYHDVAFQKHVLEKCGVSVTGAYLVYLNREYRRHGDLDVSFGGLFLCSEDLSSRTREQKDIEKNIALAKAVAESANEPQTQFCSTCSSCEFFGYCKRDLPKPSVLDLAGCKSRWKYANSGILTMRQLLDSGEELDARVRQQAEHACYEKQPDIDKNGIKKFLSTLWYPLCFLDFETMQSALPQFDGTHTYQQIPFQYSLHVIAKEGADPQHFEFLAEPEGDPRRALAEQLTKDVPEGACVVAYNMMFERSVLKELAEAFSDLAPRLIDIRKNVRDVMIPFHDRYYYNRAMQGSYSLKYVTPALFPDEKEADYHNLEGVHNGSEAMEIFPRMKDMTEAERAEARKQLLVYCGYDTWNTVKIWQELTRVAK